MHVTMNKIHQYRHNYVDILNDKTSLNSNLQKIVQGRAFLDFATLVDIAQAIRLNLAHTDAATALPLVCD